MSSPKAYAAIALLAIFILVLQNTDGRICRRKNYVCPNTTLFLDASNPVTYRAFQRQYITDVFTSIFRPREGKSVAFIAKLLQHVNTDSPSELDIYFRFALRSMSYLAMAQDNPGLCVAARTINASVEWALTENGNDAANALRTIGATASGLCTIMSNLAMSELGCDNVPESPNTPSRCAGRGTVIRLKEAMELFGNSLPCCIYVGVFELNESPIFIDKLLSVSFALAITPEFSSVFNFATLNPLLEISYMLLNRNTSICCCSKRQSRLAQLCTGLNSTVNLNIQTLIDEIYLVNECATELPSITECNV